MTRTKPTGTLKRAYRGAIAEAGCRWNNARGETADAVEQVIAARGRATIDPVRQITGGAYHTVRDHLRRMADAGVLERVKVGWSVYWYLPGTAPRDRPQLDEPDQVESVIDRMRRGLEEALVPVRGQLTMAHHRTQQAVEALMRARDSAGGETQLADAVNSLNDAASYLELRIAALAGIDPKSKPLDLESLQRECEVMRDQEPAEAVPL